MDNDAWLKRASPGWRYAEITNIFHCRRFVQTRPQTANELGDHRFIIATLTELDFSCLT